MNQIYSPSRRFSPLPVVAVVVLVGLVCWLGLKLVKYNYPDWLASANDVPRWMVDGHYANFTDGDMLALRRDQCKYDPIFMRPKADGTAVLTCGAPVQTGSVRLFVTDKLDPNGIATRTGVSSR